MTLNMNSRIKQTANMLSTTMDNELVLLHMASNSYVGLDEIGRMIWELSAEPVTVENICYKLSEKFEASPEEIANDVLPFMESLLTEKLLEQV